MMDQFQQSMQMVVQVFATMHRDQMEVIRAELDRLRELTDEFHALKDELANRTREQALTVWREPSGHDQAAAAAVDRAGGGCADSRHGWFADWRADLPAAGGDPGD